VVVRARVTAEERIITVHDHGPGVPHEAVAYIFDRFFRVPDMQVQSGSGVGLGLGLHISKEIIERHGGRIWVESKLGHGSDFSFALPRP
jgi:signal transduction histidine kinase